MIENKLNFLLFFFISLLSCNTKYNLNEVTKIEVKYANETFSPDINETKQMIINSKKINGTYLWKGYKTAQLFDNKNIIIDTLKISIYGNFYYSKNRKRFFTVNENDIQLWRKNFRIEIFNF